MKENEPTRKNYDFYGTISRAVLENYLSRSMTMNGLLTGAGCTQDHLRMIRELGAKFIGRALNITVSEGYLFDSIKSARPLIERLHQIDPQIILQATLLEGISEDVDTVTIPEFIFEAFSHKPEKRTYRYRDMLFPDGSYVDLWRAGASVPDITRLETQMWFYHRACAYIDAGIEAIHFGQVQLMGRDDPGLRTWFS